MRSFVKTLLYLLAYVLDMGLRCVGIKKDAEVSILMYHSVEESNWKFSVTPTLFEKQMHYLVRRYTVVSLSDMVLYAEGKKDLRRGSVAITIDDGYEDTYTTVFPVMKKLNLPFTVFLTTDLKPSAKLGNFPRITWDQIVEMYRSGIVTFEVHGHMHKNLSEISHDESSLMTEIISGRTLLEEKLQYRSDYIAYASGHKNELVIEFLKRNGFRAGFTINEGFIRRGDNPFLLRRTQVDGTMNFLLFKLRLTGAVELNRMFVDGIRTSYD